MNGIHDLGGAPGFGPVEAEPHEPVFHHDWERRTFAMVVACGSLRRWNLDSSRHAREHMPAADYLATSYYEHWLFGLERLLDRTALLTRDELSARLLDPKSPFTGSLPEAALRLPAANVQKVLRDPRGAKVNEDVVPRFKAGDPVRAKNLNPEGHTRLPRYCRGKAGVIEMDQGVWVFPDTHAATGDKKPQHVYAVRFAAAELWGPGASPRDFVFVDLWDDYLDPA